MRCLPLISALLFAGFPLFAQQPLNTSIQVTTQAAPENIYKIKQQFLQKVLHNPNDMDTSGSDNDLAKFNRWFNFVEPRCYPSGNMPRPDILLNESLKAGRSAGRSSRVTGTVPLWQPLGPTNVPAGFNGIGRINCIVINPQDTNTLYVGAPCGGVWISHDAGASWNSNTDNFPSLSVGDIAVNPHNPDTLYAATGDGYGAEFYGAGLDSIFWGGLYSAGVMKSTDGGNTWNTTGLSFLQYNRDIIQKLLIHPSNPNILLAATRHGTYRTADAGNTWTLVDTSHVFSMAFHPFQPDTIYAITTANLEVSYDAGVTWQVINSGINPFSDRATVAVSPASPKSVWVLIESGIVSVSHDEGNTFTTAGTTPAYLYGYYDCVLGISPVDSNDILVMGLNMTRSLNAGATWSYISSTSIVHADNHAIAFNPLNPATVYTANDGGIWVSHDGLNTFTNLSNGLMISQIYRMSSSRQNPYIMLCGLQDNATFYNDGTNWLIYTGPDGDGEYCAIYPGNDSVQIASTQNGNFKISTNKGYSFSNITSGAYGYWTAPVAFNPYSADSIYFGYTDIYASYDRGVTFTNLTSSTPFINGAVCLALSPMNTKVLYASDLGKILRTMDGGLTWTDVTGSLATDSLPIKWISVDYKNPMLLYAAVSGYSDGNKVFVSTTGGNSWANISSGLPNIPANCIIPDSSDPGALYLATDMGIYFRDSSMTSWMPYGTGLPNVVVEHLEINYTNHKLRAPTYGRGVWETTLQKNTVSVPMVNAPNSCGISIFPNPATTSWQLVFSKQKPANYVVNVADETGKEIYTQLNNGVINASNLAAGVYTIEVVVGDAHYSLKGVKK